MGSESSKSDSNCSHSNSESVSNSGDSKGKIETMECLERNSNTNILRVWIVKKSISLQDEHINFYPNMFTSLWKKNFENSEDIKLSKPQINIFKIKNEYHTRFKHWAIILELSNYTYVNIQFGRNGFSLREFNKTDFEGESVLNSIIETWGEKTHPVSFCYLGCANYRYEKLKDYLKEKKNNEKKFYEKDAKTFYNLTFKNCQHFACEIEKKLFNKIKVWHEFNFYLDDFFINFFPNINLNSFKLKYDEKRKKENTEKFLNNLKLIEELEKKYPSKDMKFTFSAISDDNLNLFVKEINLEEVAVTAEIVK